jgi:hypothetical protein
LKLKEEEIEANYKYVRFLPSSKDEYDEINGNPEMDVFEYPLDRKIIKKGNFYREESLKKSEFGWIYAAVPINMKLNQHIKTEEIDLLFLPEGNGKEDVFSRELETSKKEKKAIYKEIEKESFTLVGDSKYGNPKSNKKAKVQDWYVTGRIRVEDERLSYNESTNTYVQNTAGWVPVPGCLVRGNRYFTTKSAITKDDGTFRIEHGWPNNSGVDMDIKWDRGEFDIRTGNYGQAITSNQNIYTQWFPNITKAISPNHYIYAHVHRAAVKYFYHPTIYGLVRPSDRTWFTGANLAGQKLHLGSGQGTNASHYFQFNQIWLASQVRLIFDFNNTGIDARSIYGTTIHELAHAAHWKIGMTYLAYCSNAVQAGRMAESWAEAVGWFVTRDVYGTNELSPWLDFDSNQLMSLAAMNQAGNCLANQDPWYTPLFIDLIDDYNQVVQQSNRPNDEASGYLISDLQNYLINRPTNWYMYRDWLANNSQNLTEPAAVQLFADYDF